jgi:GTP-binding protein
MVDLPGYGFAKVARTEKERWGKMIESYLRHRTQLCGVIQLLDIRHPPSENDLLMKDWLQKEGIPLLVVATKADKISRGARSKNLAVIRKNMNLDLEPLFFSAQTGAGRDELLEEIDMVLSGQDDGDLVT